MLNRRFLRIRVIQALYAYFKGDIPLASAEKNLAFNLIREWELYVLLLQLIVEVRRFAEERIEAGMNKNLPTEEERNPNRQFIDNQLITQLMSSESLVEFLKYRKLSWHRNPDLIKHLYSRMMESEYYINYMNRPAKYRDDVRVVLDFYRLTVSDDDILEGEIEAQSVGWNDAIEYAVTAVCKSLEHLHCGENFIISEQYAGEEDATFANELFLKTTLNKQLYHSYIEQVMSNWDMERIAELDYIIMLTAIAELVNFSSIPIKVTMDEYIEIAKYYSTPSSGQFVNGVLDKVIGMLSAEERIVKTGRGLID